MATVRRHIPNFIDVDDDQKKPAEYSTQDELLTIPWIKQWAENKNFHQFSIAKQRGYDSHLMAELKGGREWWVIGYLSSDDGLTLPKWEPIQDDGTPKVYTIRTATVRSDYYTHGLRLNVVMEGVDYDEDLIIHDEIGLPLFLNSVPTTRTDILAWVPTIRFPKVRVTRDYRRCNQMTEVHFFSE
jgi:hypothetical protein